MWFQKAGKELKWIFLSHRVRKKYAGNLRLQVSSQDPLSRVGDLNNPSGGAGSYNSVPLGSYKAFGASGDLDEHPPEKTRKTEYFIF